MAYTDDRRAMDVNRLHTTAELIGKELEVTSNDRFKLKHTHFEERPKGTFNFRLTYFDMTNPNAEMIYKTKMSVQEYLVKQLTHIPNSSRFKTGVKKNDR